ncbi:MAG: sigma-70 family polymerase sigma factor [Bacteroidetes bacterium]|nr:sigma-70 family polymerase sigma factor [Bacteroidota bacterium]
MLPEIEKQQIDASKKDAQCFEPLYVKYYEQILKFVYKRVENLDDCREVTSTVFTKALVNIHKYKDHGFPFSSWLYRIAINEINQFYRDTNKMRVISLDEKEVRNLEDETESTKTELISSLKRSLAYLSEEELLLIELRYFEERPFVEVAQILNITENNAKVKTYRVIDKLKSIYPKVISR